MDPTGLEKIWFEFTAFIPGSHGKTLTSKAPNLTAPSGTWIEEPFGISISPFYVSPWYYRTDNRTFGGGTGRVWYRGWIESTEIGMVTQSEGWAAKSGTSGSERVRETSMFSMWISESASSNVKGTARAYNSPGYWGQCGTTIRVSATGGDPLLEPFAPNVDFNVAFNFEVVSTDTIEVSVNGVHDGYPAYEAIVTTNGPGVLGNTPVVGSPMYKFDPGGGGFWKLSWGLNTTMIFGTKARTIHAAPW